MQISSTCHAKNETRAEEPYERYRVRYFSHCRLQGAYSGADNLFSGESVYGRGHDDVDCCCDAFLDGDGPGEIAGGVFHFGEDGGEGLVSSERKRNVEECRDGLREICASDRFQIKRGGAVAWPLDAERDHDEENGDDDTGCAWPGCPRYEAHGARDAESPHCDGRNNGECNCACRVRRDCVETNCESDQS